ncbi:MAG: tetratricopeptide repeat protein [Candidatus Zixiibacteriota bacterium]|nr:MAG: tetratricopeptide repeat protein [candidate division Zixibacteria bacterium]
MKRTFFVSAVSLILFWLVGCGGRPAIKGIAEREARSADLPPRYEISARAYDYFTSGTIYELIGAVQLANRRYAEALKYYPESREIRYAYAASFLRLQDFRSALTEARKVSPPDFKTWYLIADCYRYLGIADSSILAYRKVIEFDPANVQAYYRLSSYYEDAGNIDSAIWAFEQIIQSSPSARAYLQLGNLQIRARRLEDAEANYRQSLALDSTANNVRAYLGLSAIMEDRGDVERAREYLESAARLAPQDLLIQNRLLAFYQVNRMDEKALGIAGRILSLAPNDSEVVRRLALVYFEADSLFVADSLFTWLIDHGDENVITYYYGGRLALAIENMTAAKSRFMRLTALADSIVDGWLNLGLVYRIEDSLDREITIYERGLKHMTNLEDSSRILFSLGVTLEQHGRFDHAVEAFERLLVLAPDHSQALNYLGYMLADKGIRLEHARSLIEKALEIMPENGAYIDSYGWVLYRLGELENALAELLRAVRYEQRDPVVMEHVGDVYEALGDTEKAAVYWNKALELDPDNETLKEKLEK